MRIIKNKFQIGKSIIDLFDAKSPFMHRMLRFVSGEHGIGLSKKPFMHYQFNPVELELFRSIKKVFDPDNLLNPGKIF
jgi:FAD/FMN-containing dehydrogenase